MVFDAEACTSSCCKISFSKLLEVAIKTNKYNICWFCSKLILIFIINDETQYNEKLGNSSLLILTLYEGPYIM